MDAIVFHQRIMRSTMATCTPGRAVTRRVSDAVIGPCSAPGATLASPMFLTEIGSSLCALSTAVIFAALAPTVPNAERRPTSCTFRAFRHRAPLPTAVGDTKLGPAMHALRAAACERAALAPAMPFAKGSASLSSLAAIRVCAPFAPAMRLTERRAALSTPCALRKPAAPAPTMRDAQAGTALGALRAVLPLASISPTMLDATARFPSSGSDTALVAAAATAAMGYAVVRAPFGTLCAAEMVAPPTASMAFAEDGAALSPPAATGFLAPLTPAMGYTEPGSTTGTFFTTWVLTGFGATLALLCTSILRDRGSQNFRSLNPL